MIFPNTETRPFFVEQSKSGRWNVWVYQRATDEGLYNLAAECGDYETLVDVLYNDYGVKETKDGVAFNDPKVNVIQLNSDVFDF